MSTPTQPSRFDVTFVRLLRVVGLGLTIFEVVVYRVEHPELLLLTGPMMGIASLLKPNGSTA